MMTHTLNNNFFFPLLIMYRIVHTLRMPRPYHPSSICYRKLEFGFEFELRHWGNRNWNVSMKQHTAFIWLIKSHLNVAHFYFRFPQRKNTKNRTMKIAHKHFIFRPTQWEKRHTNMPHAFNDFLVALWNKRPERHGCEIIFFVLLFLLFPLLVMLLLLLLCKRNSFGWRSLQNESFYLARISYKEQKVSK